VQQGLAFYPGVERKRQPESQLSLIKAREEYISSRALCVQLSLCRLSTSLSHSPCFHYREKAKERAKSKKNIFRAAAAAAAAVVRFR